MMRLRSEAPLQVVVRIISWLLPVLLVCLFLDSAWHHIHQEARSVITDGHYTRSVNFYHWIKTGDSHFLLRYGEPILLQEGLDPSRFPLHNPYPPLVYAVTALVYSVAGPSLLAARLSLLAFGIPLLLASFLIGRRLTGYWGGILVLSMVATSPLLLTFSRLYFLDFPRAALVIVSLYCLMESDGFRSRRGSLAFGLMAGLSMLSGWTVPLFLALPTLWMILPAVVRAIHAGFHRSWVPLLTVVLTLLWGGTLFLGLGWSLQGCVTPTYWLELHQWRIYLLWSVLVPTGGLLGALVALHRRSIGNQNIDQRDKLTPVSTTNTEAGVQVAHFAQAVAVAVLLFAPWYWYMLGDMRAHVQTNVAHAFPLTPLNTLEYLSRLVKQGLWMGPLGAGLGLVGGLFLRQGRGMGVILPLSGLLVLCVLLQTGRPDHFFTGDVQVRITLPALPLVAVAAVGWLGWVELLGRRRKKEADAERNVTSGGVWIPVMLGLVAMAGASLALVGWRAGESTRAWLEPLFGKWAATYLRPPLRANPDVGRSSFIALTQRLGMLHSPELGYGRVQVILDPSLAHELGSERFYTQVLNTAHLQLWMQQAFVPNMVPLAQYLLKERGRTGGGEVDLWMFLAPGGEQKVSGEGHSPAVLTPERVEGLGMPMAWFGVLEGELSVVILSARGGTVPK